MVVQKGFCVRKLCDGTRNKSFALGKGRSARQDASLALRRLLRADLTSAWWCVSRWPQIFVSAYIVQIETIVLDQLYQRSHLWIYKSENIYNLQCTPERNFGLLFIDQSNLEKYSVKVAIDCLSWSCASNSSHPICTLPSQIPEPRSNPSHVNTTEPNYWAEMERFTIKLL